ncbi:DUF6993 domain-containing protein [Agrococcus jejuensis]|uniref:DUF6993 domain-containing protein n=1 Tax=Agrococcus jejuensis TaxID=399736 RepID=A0A1G8GPE3_9MICO|nr:hypothetical protein [Agrococcus jejuensis]SDH96207.1 hypothetical protein SAMN04489720_3014 [Agrococcus jejuensis]
MRRQAALLATGIAAVLALAGCGGDAAPAPSPSASAAPSESAPPAEELTGAAALQQQFADVLAANDVAGQPDGEALVAALVAAGFDQAAIERSDDVDVQGNPVALMTVAVRVDQECLLGQVGHGAPTSTIVPVLGTGTCLVAPFTP